MLIPNKLNTLIRILLVNHFQHRPNLQLSVLAKKARISPTMIKKLTLRLERSEYVKISKVIRVINPVKLLIAWSYSYSIRELSRLEFVAAERPQYVMSKIANKARIEKLNYAFTLFSATENVSPYVAPSDTYLYINKKDINAWQKMFNEENILPIEKSGNVICLVVDEDYFEGVWEARDVNIVSIPQLYADLFSYGGRGEDAASEILARFGKNV